MNRALLFPLALVSLALTATVATLDAQEPTAPPIRVDVQEVMVPVTVRDAKGRFVSNLEKSDFKIYDQGKEQTLTYFSRDRSQPVVVGFLLDLSSASNIQWKDYRESAIDLVLTLLNGDKRYSGYLIGYNQASDVLVNTTSDPEPIIEKLRSLKPGGGSALHDAIYSAVTNRKLVVGEPFQPRRIIVIIGDGHDNASSKSFDEVLELAQRNQVTVFGISTTAYGFGSEGETKLEKLCFETGGRVWYPLQNVYKDVAGYLQVPSDEGNYVYKVGTGGYASSKAQAFFKAIADLTGEVTTQYILRFTPTEQDSNKVVRELNVKVSLPDVIVSAKRHYFPYNPNLAVPPQSK